MEVWCQLSARICRWKCRLLAEALGGGLAGSCLPESAGGGGTCRLLAEAVGGGLALAVCHNLQVEAAPAGCWQRL